MEGRGGLFAASIRFKELRARLGFILRFFSNPIILDLPYSEFALRFVLTLDANDGKGQCLGFTI